MGRAKRQRHGEKPLEMSILPRGEDDYGVTVWQILPSGNSSGGEKRFIVRVWGTPFRSVVAGILDAIKRAGYRASDLHRKRKKPFTFGEADGVRLALLLLAVKPLRKTERIHIISEAITSMSEEEAYYWFSKCTAEAHGRRASKALRILLAKE